MASYIDMSLEDIIQKKRGEKKRTKTIPEVNKFNRQVPTKKFPITDARNKIISKKRTQITDAREKLAELAKKKDARLKLEQLRRKRQAMTQTQNTMGFQNHGKFINKDRVFIDPSRQVVSQPLVRNKMPIKRQINTKKFLVNRSIESKAKGKIPPLKPIIRTVENDIETFDDPMDGEYVSSKTFSLNNKPNLQFKIQNNNMQLNRSLGVHRTAVTEKDTSPPRLPSILKKRPMVALRSETKEEKTDKPTVEYRIIVSNLRNTVTGIDMEELFGDVGGMLDARLVRPGTAEIIYKTLKDAQRAVDLYHNRQLDGQPMNCLLVTPRTNAAQSKSNSKLPLQSNTSDIEPDITTVHKALFSQF